MRITICVLIQLLIVISWFQVAFGNTATDFAYSSSIKIMEPFSVDLTDTIKLLEAEIKENPNNSRIKIVLGLIYLDLGSASIDSETSEFKYNSDYLEKSEKLFINVLDKRKYEPLAYYYLGLLRMQKYDVVHAINYYNNAIIADNTFLQAYIKLHTIYLMQKDFVSALNTLNKAIKYCPDSAELFHKLSITYLAVSDYDNTIKYAKLALKISDNIETQLVLASSYSMTKKYHESITVLENILAKDFDNKSALLGLSTVYKKMGENSKAIDVLKKTIEYYPNDKDIKKILSDIQ